MPLINDMDKLGDVFLSSGVKCPVCGEEYFSPMDKSVIRKHKACGLCCDDEIQKYILGHMEEYCS